MNELLHETRLLIPQYFDLEERDRLFLHQLDEQREEIERFLSARISEMIDGEFEKLVNAMYRIDVPEPAFHEAMMFDNRADRLAVLVIERLIQKARTRIWYRNLS